MLFGFATVVAIVVLVTAACGNDPRPNVVLVVVDTLRADHLPFYGYGRDTMPHLGEIARDAFVFEDCVTPIPMTDPAFASLLTGELPVRHGVRDTGYRLVDDVPTLTERLQEAGYHTAAVFSREGLGSSSGLGRGFDMVDDDTVAPGEEGDHPWYTKAGAEKSQRRAWEATDRALSWLDERTSDPFFLLLHYFDPHAYYDPPAEFLGTFAPEPTPFDQLQLRSWWGPVTSLGTNIARYDEELLTVDAHLQRFVNELKRRGLWDKTVFILTADHGESFGEHNAMDHGEWLWQQQIHVPFILRLPGGETPPPRRIPQMVRLIDIMPTVLDLAGIWSPDNQAGAVPGRSLRGLLFGQKEEPNPIILESENCPTNPNNPTVIGNDCYPPGTSGKLRGIREGRWKFVVNPTREGYRLELFDLDSDPEEIMNVAPDHPSVVSDFGIRVQKASEGELQGLLDADLVERLRALGYAD